MSTTNDVPMAAVRFGAILRSNRETLGLSLRDVAEAAGVAHTYVHDVERGHRCPPIATARRIAAQVNAVWAVDMLPAHCAKCRDEGPCSCRGALERIRTASRCGCFAVLDKTGSAPSGAHLPGCPNGAGEKR